MTAVLAARAPASAAPDVVAPGASLVDPELVTPCRAASDPDLWFRTAPADEAAAAQACESCPVRMPCLRAAMDHEAGAGARGRFGVWGGRTPWARDRMARTWSRTRRREARAVGAGA